MNLGRGGHVRRPKLAGCFDHYGQFPGKPAAEVSYKNELTYRSVPVLSNTRVPQSNARAPDF